MADILRVTVGDCVCGGKVETQQLINHFRPMLPMSLEIDGT